MVINVSMEGSFDAVGFRVKLYNDLGGIGITHEDSICTSRRDGYMARGHAQRYLLVH